MEAPGFLKRLARRVLREELYERDRAHALDVAYAVTSATSAVIENHARLVAARAAFNAAHTNVNN